MRGNENSPENFKAEVIYEFLFGKKPEGAHFADSDVDALCSMVTKQPFLAEIRAAVQPVGTFRQAYVNLKEKWQQAVPNPEPDLAQISEDEEDDQDELGETEAEDDQLNSDGDETEAGEMRVSEDTWESVDHSIPRAFSGPPSEKAIKLFPGCEST